MTILLDSHFLDTEQMSCAWSEDPEKGPRDSSYKSITRFGRLGIHHSQSGTITVGFTEETTDILRSLKPVN